MQKLDMFILLAAAASFVTFLLAHLGAFRYTARQNILKTLCKIFVFGWVIGLILLAVLLMDKKLFLVSLLVTVAFHSLIYGLLCFLYVLYVFGPFESSIRFRLIFELYQNHPQGMERQEIDKRYNPDIFLKRRLERLVASGDLVQDGEVYRLVRERSIFILLDEISQKLKAIVSKRSP